jgi:hypothetical protein
MQCIYYVGIYSTITALFEDLVMVEPKIDAATNPLLPPSKGCTPSVKHHFTTVYSTPACFVVGHAGFSPKPCEAKPITIELTGG